MKRETAASIMLAVGLAAFALCLVIHTVQLARLRQRVELLERVEKPVPTVIVRYPTHTGVFWGNFELQGKSQPK